MDASDFLPDQQRIEQIRRDLAAYEEQRKAAHAAVRRRMAVAMGGLAAAAMPALVLFPDILFGNLYAGMAVLGGFVFGGIYLYELARKPAHDLQESFRNDLFGSIFGFISGFRHWRGSIPGSFARLPAAVAGDHNHQTFDDEISGRMGDFRFNLYEAHLERKASKSSRTTFKGVVLSFDLPRPFPGRLVATRRIGDIARILRDTFGKDGLLGFASGRPALDEAYEFRTDNEPAAMLLVAGSLGKALEWLREAWPDEPARIALADRDGFLLLPVRGRRNFFELPDIAVPLDYSAHIALMIADMAKLLAIGDLVRKASVPADD